MNRLNQRITSSLHLDQVIVCIVALVLFAVSLCYSLDGSYYLEGDLLASRISGYGALGLLAVSILFGPVLRIATRVGLFLDGRVSMRVSKDTGIASAMLAIAHSVISVTGCLAGEWREVLDRSYLYAGFLALVILTLLLVFSIKPLTRRVEWRLWKPTFRLSIAAATLAFGHVFYAPFASMRWTLLLYGGATLLFLLRFLPPKGRNPHTLKENPVSLSVNNVFPPK